MKYYSHTQPSFEFIMKMDEFEYLNAAILEKELKISNSHARKVLSVLTIDNYLIRVEQGAYLTNKKQKDINDIEVLCKVLNKYLKVKTKISDSPIESLLKSGLTTQVTTKQKIIWSSEKSHYTSNRINKIIKSLSKKRVDYFDLSSTKDIKNLLSKYLSMSDNYEEVFKLIERNFKGHIKISSKFEKGKRNIPLLNLLGQEISINTIDKLREKGLDETFVIY